MNIPKMIKIRQKFNDHKLNNIEEHVKNEIDKLKLEIKPGMKIAITSGSRGVDNIAKITKAVVDTLKEKGAQPFIIPAMGSHGGATAQGQVEVLESYGITQESMEVPIKSSMEVVELSKGDLKNSVYMDKYAYEADATVLINRIKAHTDFVGPNESGLMKMAVIGLGKHAQATAIHNYGVSGLSNLIIPTARQIFKHGNIIMGVGIVENAYDKTLAIKAMKTENIEEEEKKLLKYAKENGPCLPVKEADIVVVDRIGKDISGTGMDTNVVGKRLIKGAQDPEYPKINMIITTDLTEASHGNATGMGIADIITENLRKKIDFPATYANAITATFLLRASMPVVAKNDKEAMEIAIKTYGPISTEKAKIIRIKDTLHLDEMYVSKPVIEEIKDNDNIKIIGEFIDIIDSQGNFIKM